MMRTKIFIVNCLILFSGSILFGQEKIGVHSLYFVVGSDKELSPNVDSLYWELIPDCLNKMDSLHLNHDDSLNKDICPTYFGNHHLKFIKEKGEITCIVHKYANNEEGADLYFSMDSLVCISFDSCLLYSKGSRSNSQDYQVRQIISFDENKMTVREKILYESGHNDPETEVIFDSFNYELKEYYFDEGFLIKFEHTTVRHGKKGRLYWTTLDNFIFQNSFFIVETNQEGRVEYFQVFTFDNATDLEHISKRVILELKFQHYAAVVNVKLPYILLHFPELMEKVK